MGFYQTGVCEKQQRKTFGCEQRLLIFARKIIGAKTLWECLDFRNGDYKCRVRFHAADDTIVHTVCIHNRAANSAKEKCKNINDMKF